MSRTFWAALLVAFVYLSHAAVHLSQTFIEAGLSFAAADALLDGLGLAPWPHAAWSETFDRPLWVLLLAGMGRLGVQVDLAAKGLGLLLGGAGLGLCGAAARQLGLRGPWPWVAAGVLALQPWWVVWSVSGSGEVLYASLVLAGLVRLGVELSEDRMPLAGALLGLAAVARWDGMLALSPVVLAVFGLSWRRRGLGFAAVTLGLALLPLAMWEVVRLVAFDALLPPMAEALWGGHPGAHRRVWRLLFRHHAELSTVLALSAAVGLRFARGRLPVLLVVGLLGELLALLAVGGDWVTTGRRLQLGTALAVPLAVGGWQVVWTRTRSWRGRGLVGLLGVGVVYLSLERSADHARAPETLLTDGLRRVEHIQAHAENNDIINIFVADPDVAAYLCFTSWPLVDLSGHTQADALDRRALIDRLLAPDGPTYVHLHGGWARAVRATEHPDWEATFVEIPGYPIGNGRTHVGTYVRRAALPFDECGDGGWPGAHCR